MISTIQFNNQEFKIDFSQPIDISIELKSGKENPLAWYIDPPKIEPVQLDDWIGSVTKGASTNFNNVQFNPHAHGTHTECVGHITKEFYSINDCLKTFFFQAELISVQPKKIGDDLVITKEQIQDKIKFKTQALIIRTLPNNEDKLTTNYAHKNPPYIELEAMELIRELGVEHLLIDLPSVDKEKDEGKLLCHNEFWNTKGEIRKNATITEFIYVPEHVDDGMYFLNLQIASFQNDASPSKPVLYKMIVE